MSAAHHAANTLQLVNPPKKSFMVKNRVGVARTSTYELPENPLHVYGYTKPPDEMRCGEIMSSWVAADPSAGKVSCRSYVHSNILSIRNGCITATAMRQYIEAHPNIRLKEEAPESLQNKGNHEGPFGVKTRFANESMKDLMQCNFTNFIDDDTDYPDTSNIMKMSSFPMPIATKASELLMSTRKQEKEMAQTPTRKFCMKKFQNVKSKLSADLNLTPTRRTNPNRFQDEVSGFQIQAAMSNPALLSNPMSPNGK